MYGRTTSLELKGFKFTERESTTREEYINSCRILFCGLGKTPINCYVGQMELILLHSYVDDWFEKKMFRLYHEMARKQYMISHHLTPLDFRMDTFTQREIVSVLSSTGMSWSERAVVSSKEAMRVLTRYKFQEAFTLQNSCIDMITGTVIEKVKKIAGPGVFFTEYYDDMEGMAHVYSILNELQLLLPHSIFERIKQRVLGTVAPFRGREILTSPRCRLYKILHAFARGEYMY